MIKPLILISQPMMYWEMRKREQGKDKEGKAQEQKEGEEGEEGSESDEEGDELNEDGEEGEDYGFSDNQEEDY